MAEMVNMPGNRENVFICTVKVALRPECPTLIKMIRVPDGNKSESI
jgi:hypothetical protein